MTTSTLRKFRNATDDTAQAYTDALRAATESTALDESQAAVSQLGRVHRALVAWGNAWEAYAREVSSGEGGSELDNNDIQNGGAAFLARVPASYEYLNSRAKAHKIAAFEPSEGAFDALQFALCRVDPSKASKLWSEYKALELPVKGFIRGRKYNRMKAPEDAQDGEQPGPQGATESGTSGPSPVPAADPGAASAVVKREAGPTAPSARTPRYVAAAIALSVFAIVVFFGPSCIHAITALQAPTFSSCAQAALVKSNVYNESKALQIAASMLRDAGSVTMTNQTREKTEYRDVSDDNARMLVQGCADQFHVALPNVALRSTITVRAGAAKRGLAGARVYLQSNQGDSCTTSRDGQCDLTLTKTGPKNDVTVVASHQRFGESVKKLSGEKFLDGLVFDLEPAPRTDILIRRAAKALPGATVTLRATNADIWNERCDSAGDDMNCNSEQTNVFGVARFYSMPALENAIVDVMVDGIPKTFPVKISSGQASVDWPTPVTGPEARPNVTVQVTNSPGSQTNLGTNITGNTVGH